MEKSIYSLPISFSVVDELETEDSRFLKVIIDVLHTGVNYNESFFTKEVVDENIETIKNTPILGFVRKLSFDEKDFKGHEYVITKIEDGVERKYVGSAYGVIPESCNPRWITKITDTGEEREFLQVDGVLWTKFKDSTEIMERDFTKAESMEVDPNSVEGYEDEETGIFHFTKFSFDGCCILGDGIQPAMENACITINEVQFTVSDFVKNIQSELNDKYKAFTRLVEKKESKNNEGKLQNDEEGGNDDMATDFSQTIMQMFEDTRNLVCSYEQIENIWGDKISRYDLIDIQEKDSNIEAIIVDFKDNCNIYGCEFSVDGDKPVVNFKTAKRKKITYTDYVEGEAPIEGAFNFGIHISEIENSAFKKVSEAEKNIISANEAKATAETDYSNLKEQYDEIKPKYDEYVKAEIERIEAETKKAKEDVIARYEIALKDNDEFIAMKDKLDEYSTADDVEAKCAIMFARKNLVTDFSANGKKGSVILGAKTEDEVTEGYVETKYGMVRTSK